MKVTVFGTGYVGLVQGAVLADVGHEVVCLDIDKAKVEMLSQGRIPIYEPGLETIVKTNLESGNIQFTTDYKTAISHGDVLFIAVGTPPDENGSADLKYVLDVATSIAQQIESYKVVINKSTVPVGTADKVKARIDEVLAQRSKSVPYDVVSNPEFLKEGSAVNDCLRPDRIIVGTDSERAEHIMRELYAPFNRNHEKIIVMDARSAELTKYAANCILATKISFINEIASLADKLGADVEKVRNGIGSDPRIGYEFIYPGVGYGGSCFPKDVQALIKTADDIGFDAMVLKAVEARNQIQKTVIFDKISDYFSGDLKGRVFALWGLSFKPNTDDMREAPSRVLMEALWEAGAIVQAYDPAAMDETRRIYPDADSLKLCTTKELALEGAEALVVITEWKSFRAPNFDLIKASLRNPLIFDGRNIYDPASVVREGFEYFSIGRP
ncbi:UDP-glucose/GDP-mannose dehydrogenase family protein [Pseudomonas sp. p106]|uniref:UDP-glucose dehydrogenase family protein n=1 Tax=Pseudomonas sp. p106 TaxID=2479854 RepID=UPI000F7796F6|nr:UDP-glucose/GDP-mannose dehydrogenase family protein [Pseudomonas sp. p106]RRV44842.1 UDP-glucose/GDP-mannose dehydrogenase family protein [Pseudomonas sp. p106]